MIQLLLFNESWWVGINAVWAILGILILVALAGVYFLGTKRRETDKINADRADASDKLVKVRDQQISDLEKENTRLTKKLEDTNEELEATTAEYRVLAGLKIDELLQYAERRRETQAKWDNIEEVNANLRLRLLDKTDG